MCVASATIVRSSKCSLGETDRGRAQIVVPAANKDVFACVDTVRQVAFAMRVGFVPPYEVADGNGEVSRGRGGGRCRHRHGSKCWVSGIVRRASKCVVACLDTVG